MKFTTGQKGFSLIEIIIVLFIFSASLGLFFDLYKKHNDIFLYEQGLFKAADSARVALNEINTLTLQANQVLASRVINGNNYNSGPGVLVLQLPSANSSGSIIANAYDYAAFYVTGNQLWVQVQAGTGSYRLSSGKILSTSVNSLTFSYDNSSFPSVKTVLADLQTREVVRSQTINYQLSQRIRLRNN